MKLFILSLFITQIHCTCHYGNTEARNPAPQYIKCVGSAPDKDQTLLTLSGGRPLDYVEHFMLKKYSDNLYPEMLTILPGLHTLSIINNSFKTIPKDFFMPCAENLELLIIINNEVESIDTDAFLDMKKLTHLYLLRNVNLKDFSVESLRNCNKMEILNVPAQSFNQLEVAKLKNYFPSLRVVGVYEGEKDLVKDKVKELERIYNITFETTLALYA